MVRELRSPDNPAVVETQFLFAPELTALLFSEERGTVERFRPFEPPSAGELTELLGT